MSRAKRLYLAHLLSLKKATDDPDKLNQSIASANIDLNPHQVDAAIFAFKSPLSRGAILAEEVGLGKTIEAGLIINQIWVEGRRSILILVPASLRTQWQDELNDRFNLASTIIDGQTFKRLQREANKSNPLTEPGIYIASHNFAYRYDIFCREIQWDLVVIDEAHRLRNVWRKSNKVAKKIRDVIRTRPKLLLTATPLQNNLMELFGLTSFLDENYLGTEYSFRTLFLNPIQRHKQWDRLSELKERLIGTYDQTKGEYQGGILTRTLRNQVSKLGLISFTKRHCITENFEPNDDEMQLYNNVSDYLRRPFLASTKATQRHMMELVYRKILASSSFAIRGTLEKVVHFLSKRLQIEFSLPVGEVTRIVNDVKVQCEKRWGKELLPFEIVEFKKGQPDEIGQLQIGFEDLETTIEKLQEAEEDDTDLQSRDDLNEEDDSEESETEENENSPQKEEREIDHTFTKEEVIGEFKDVLTYYFLSTTISRNQKSQALLKVLSRLFKYAEKKKWPQKVVIFTESRRTQDHLEKLLSDAGYNLVLFNGTNAGKRARAIFDEWASLHPKEAENDSRSINIRKALIWKFKTLDSGILITTEAGAEGVNLQFANIVINYDLPWNPQRIEQRIGRCHRYGQTLDVLVANFLNTKNYADQRVYELLREKIRLFGNLFDFSDKVLGTEVLSDDGYEVREVAMAGLGTGMDFEKKILSIYRQCRTEEEIERSFKELQLELSDIISTRLDETKHKLIEHFDAEVRQKLNVRRQKLEDALTKQDQNLKDYIQLVFPKEIQIGPDNSFVINDKKYRFGLLTEKQRQDGFLPVHTKSDFLCSVIEEDRRHSGNWEVTFKHDPEKARKHFEEYVGCKGQLLLHLLTCRRQTLNNSDEIFERLVVSAIVRQNDHWIPLTGQRAFRLLDLIIASETESAERPHDILAELSEKEVESLKNEILDDNENYIVQEMDRLNQFMKESLLKFKKEIEGWEEEISKTSSQLRASRTSGYHEVHEIQDSIDKKQKELFKAQKKYLQAQQDQFNEKDRKVEDLKGKLQMNFSCEKLTCLHFDIVS